MPKTNVEVSNDEGWITAEELVDAIEDIGYTVTA